MSARPSLRLGRSALLAAAIAGCSAPEKAPQEAVPAAAIRSRLRACAHERDHGDPVLARRELERLVVDLETRPSDGAELLIDAKAELGRTLVLLVDAPRAVTVLDEVLSARERQFPVGAAEIQVARTDLAQACRAAKDFARSRDLAAAAVETLEGSGGPDRRDLLRARVALSVALAYTGDPERARALAEESLEELRGTFGDDDPDVLLARVYLGLALNRVGRVEEAHAQYAQAEAALSATLPAGHPALLRARINLGTTTRDLGDFQGAVDLFLRVAEDGKAALSEGHAYVITAQTSASWLLSELGRPREALALQDHLLRLNERVHGPDDPQTIEILSAKGLTLRALGELEEARRLQERVLAFRSERLPKEDRQVLAARGNLAITILELGDPWAAREQFERIREVYEETLPEDHPEFLILRQNLSVALHACGDAEAARALEERTVESMSKSLPDEHPSLQVARLSLASTLTELGEHEKSRDLLEKVVAILESGTEEGHVYLVGARQNLSTVLKRLGDVQRGLELDEQVLESLSASQDPDSIMLQHAKLNLSSSKRATGEFAESCALAESALAVLSRTLPPGHVVTRRALFGLSIARRLAGDLEGACAPALELCAALSRGTGEILLRSSPREAEESTQPDRESISWLLELAEVARDAPSGPRLAREAFELIEGRRALGLRAARLQGLLRENETVRALRAREREASGRIAGLVQEGGTREALDEARAALDDAQRALATEAAREPAARAYLSEVRSSELCRKLGPEEALVGFWRYTRIGNDLPEGVEGGPVERMLAHVLAADGTLTRADLGPAREIQDLVERFRASIGGESGRGLTAGGPAGAASTLAPRELAARIFEPLRASLTGARRVTFALDDALALVPLDALPDPDSDDGVVGDRIGVRVVSALAELAWPSTEIPQSTRFLGLGGLAYGGAGEDGSPGSAGVSRAFTPLPATGPEVEGIAELFRSAEKGEAVVLEGEDGTPSAFATRASGARWVHLATHGWVASESGGGEGDATPLDPKSGYGRRRTALEQARSGTPMALCGLALSGANRTGEAAGTLTAEEIATLDLSQCEMAVLSACDTSVGVVRAGQGVASLQKALHMAGVRTVVTSLWKVPDEATGELMVDFYRRVWIERKPKAQALWEAKQRLREAGSPPRDWAAWVLTGASD